MEVPLEFLGSIKCCDVCGVSGGSPMLPRGVRGSFFQTGLGVLGLIIIDNQSNNSVDSIYAETGVYLVILMDRQPDIKYSLNL